MPEGPEVETEKLHGAIKEEPEREGGRFFAQIAPTTARLHRRHGFANARAFFVGAFLA